MKKIVLLAVICITFACANKEQQSSKDGSWDVTVSGKIEFPTKGGLVKIQELTPADNAKTDSVQIGADSTYSKTIHLTEPGYYRFTFFDQQSVDLVLDHSNIELNVDGNDQTGQIEIKGSPDYEFLRDTQMKIMAFDQQPEIQKIQEEFNKIVQGSNPNPEQVSEIQGQYIERMEAYKDNVIKEIETKPVNLGLINLLQGNTFDKDRYYPYYKQVADSAMKKWPTSIHAKKFNELVTKMAVTAIGQKAPEISLPDPNGNVVKLSSYKGKYVLVDFWAKWCGPCRQENPNVVRAYKEFHGKGFEILGVSLDRSKEDWVGAIAQDGLTWTQVSDLKYFQSQAAIDYNVSGIPLSILVDPNGIIVAKNLRGSTLRRKLVEIYNKPAQKKS